MMKKQDSDMPTGKDEKITHSEVHDHDHGHDHDNGVTANGSFLKGKWGLLLALSMLAVLLILEYGFDFNIEPPFDFVVNAVAYLLAGWNVLMLAFRKLKRGDVFNEFVLMTVATAGAFYIGEYTEGVAVMVFYAIGEWFQDSAVMKAKASIKALLDVRPDEVNLVRDGQTVRVNPSKASVGDIFLVRPGEKVALDGDLVSDRASLNTAALTGESKPDAKYKGEKVLAGMINIDQAVEVKVTALFRDSKLSRVLELVRDATARKSQTQLFISRFAKVYTPIVFFLALALVVVPYFFVSGYTFTEWLYRALVFLVISCPCALVVSIPLGYFGGIGLASRNGILFKGGNFLDVLTKIDTVVMDKTGTLTQGVFKVQQVQSVAIPTDDLLSIAGAIEKYSTHPIAKAVIDYASSRVKIGDAKDVGEIAGHGLRGIVGGKEVVAGNLKLLRRFGISYPAELETEVDTIVVIAVDNVYAGYLTIADEIKEDAKYAIERMHAAGLRTVMLSGDKQSVVSKVATALAIDDATGDLLPEGKVNQVKALKDRGRHIAFVGDGVNDAPVIALADAGIAMGGLGSDATIETADIIIQNDQPSKIVDAIRIGKITRTIVWQNIILAMAVKLVVLALGAGGVANLWEAVIADVGVALLAILNAVRIQRQKL